MKTTLCIAAASLLGMFFWQRTSAGSDIETYCGMCDASAVVALNDEYFVIADDEDSIMRIFSREKPGPAIFRTNLTTFLGFAPKDEADVEGGARIGDRFYWITSHGNNRKGKEQESRQRFFAVTIQAGASGPTIQGAGRPYAGLLDDLLNEPRLAQFNLKASLGLPPKSPGALNIEGLAATPDGRILIGFRNPIPGNEALIVPLLNPAEVVAGARARFGDPIQINLGGYGIRSIDQWRGGYLIVGGSADGKGKSRLYEWSGDAQPPRLVSGVDFEGINPEAISVFTRNGVDELLVVSDDGTRKVNGVECKKLKDPMQKTFRAVEVSIGSGVAATAIRPKE
jgi:hypothetical protein